MQSASILCLLLGGLVSTCLSAREPLHHWKLDAPKDPAITVKAGMVKPTARVHDKSLALDGAAVLDVKDPRRIGHGKGGFTLLAWVNPYTLKAGQQMIATKNVYSGNQREWDVMIDKYGRFGLYLRQGASLTVTAETVPNPGSCYQVGVVVTAKRSELWINGKREGIGELKQPLPQTDASLSFGGVNDDGRIWQDFGCLTLP